LNWFRSHCFEILSARRDSLNEDYGSSRKYVRAQNPTFDDEKIVVARHNADVKTGPERNHMKQGSILLLGPVPVLEAASDEEELGSRSIWISTALAAFDQ
jgi:hypothetical protein